ncbi:MAG: flagellar export protein FliJ [Balneolaceae bacterium]
MKFKFSLDSVLKVREHQEKIQKQKLAEEMLKKKKIEDIRLEVSSRLNNYLENKCINHAESVHSLKQFGSHMVEAHQTINKLNGEKKEADKAINSERQDLAKAHKKRHIMEKVREFELNIFSEKVSRHEQVHMDEIASQSYNR